MIDHLKVMLANNIEASNIASTLHWNVTGVNFEQYHSFYGDVYEAFYSKQDRIAEYVRIISGATENVSALTSVTKSNKTLPEIVPVNGNDTPKQIKQLITVTNHLIADNKKLFNLSQEQNEQGVANFAADCQDEFAKILWKLQSMIL
jgi:DNA-binding ferritin-like protein